MICALQVLMLNYFNSIKVRLKHFTLAELIRSTTDFNSIKVRLKRSLGPIALQGLPNFNSIKVRLKHYCSNAKDEMIPFQFHKGTIKTFRGLFPLFPVSSFQFHKGTIKTYTLTEEGRKHLNFNSIKVRLKLIISIRDKSLSTISIP